MSFPLGQTVTRSALTKVNGIPTDPATLVLTITDPLGAVTTYTWPTPATITRDNLGAFHVDLVPTVAGLWGVSWAQTGGVSIETPGGGAFVVGPALESVTVHVKTNDDDDVPGVTVQVYINDEGIAAAGYTDVNGDFACLLDPGIYLVDLEKLRVGFSNPYQVNVLNTGGLTPQTFELTCTPLDITLPGDLPKVKLFGLLAGSDGQPVSDVRVVVETVGYGAVRPFVQPPVPASGVDPINVMVRPERRELRTDTTGYWEADVVPDSLVRVEIPDVRFQRIFRVPNDPRITALNIRDARQDPGTGTEVGVSSDVGDRGVLPGDS